MEKEKCKLCTDGKEYKNIHSHLRGKHQVSLAQYRKNEQADTLDDIKDSLEEVSGESLPVTRKDTATAIFGETLEEEAISDLSLKAFLDKNELTERELLSIVKQYKTGDALPVTQMVEQREKIGLLGADELKDNAKVSTTQLDVAEALVKEYGFTVTVLAGAKGNLKKTWHLKKS